ncbi:hypothetical protein A6A29_40255 [Streptomyces sp. TSRI0281]|nr:hypothetical protein A6A29_40255 [Streptomyces sp. TSRI0281]
MEFLCEPERSRFSRVEEEMALSRTDTATFIRCRNWDSIRSQSMMFLPASPNRESMWTYSLRLDGR